MYWMRYYEYTRLCFSIQVADETYRTLTKTSENVRSAGP